MSRGRLLLLPLLAVLFILGACQSGGKLKGEVFVVTKGRSNVELGDIEVKAIRSSVWERHLREKHQRAEELVSNKVKRLKPLMDSLEAVRGELEKAERELQQVRYEHERLDRPEILSSGADEMPAAEEVNRLYTISEAEMTDIPFGDLVQEVDSGLFVEPIEKGKRQYKVRLPNSEGWIHALNIVTEKKYRDFLDSKRNIVAEEIRYEKRLVTKQKTIEDTIKSASR